MDKKYLNSKEYLENTAFICNFLGGRKVDKRNKFYEFIFDTFTQPDIELEGDYDDSYIEYIDDQKRWHISDMRFHCSWDWLIPAIKILQKGKYNYMFPFQRITNLDLDGTYDAFVEFCKWYDNTENKY